MRKGRYYLSRVVKLGQLNQERLMDAMLNSPIVELGRFDWMITDVIDGRSEQQPFIFGKLSKYAKNGSVKLVDESSKLQVNAEAPNLLEASSPFFYIPEYSGLVFLHVWNGIQEDVFPRRFKAIIERAYDNFFVGCEIEAVSDYQEFVSKIKAIDTFTELSARVHPPNPLFGRLWENLHEYVKKRKASDVFVREISLNQNGLDTNLVKLITNIVKNKNYEPQSAPDIMDAAILMAADGYGSGKIIGIENGTEVLIRTSDTQKSFLFSPEPHPNDLARLAHNNFEAVAKDRNMRH